jgi:hypothetical protein
MVEGPSLEIKLLYMLVSRLGGATKGGYLADNNGLFSNDLGPG